MVQLMMGLKRRRHAASPGFWCYISAHLHSAAGAAASGTLTKTPFPKSTPTTSNPFTTTTTTNYPTSLPIIIPAAESATTTAATTTTTTTSTTPSSKSQRPSSQLQFLQPGIPESGDGAVGVSSKIVNRILRGKSRKADKSDEKKKRFASYENGFSNISTVSFFFLTRTHEKSACLLLIIITSFVSSLVDLLEVSLKYCKKFN